MSFIYLASPYSHVGPGTPEEKAQTREKRYDKTLDCQAAMLAKGIPVFATIVHTHVTAQRHKLPTDAEFWMNYNHLMIRESAGVAVLKIDGWESSAGVQDEIEFAKKIKRPIHYVEPTADGFDLSAFD